jgi:hypothetical protein
MAEVFSVPTYPNAVGYNIEYSDPLSADPNGINPFGPWTTLGSGSLTNPSNILDLAASTDARVYRVQPIISVSGQSLPLKWYRPFRPDTPLYDPQITAGLLPQFRSNLSDYGTPQIASTDLNLDTGAGTGLLVFDGVRKIFNLADIPDANPAIVLEGTVFVVKNGKTLVEGTDYVVDYEAGQVSFAAAPVANDTCYIKFRQAAYSNNQLNAALRASIQALSSHLGLNGYYIQPDNNVSTVPVTLPDDGLKALIYEVGQQIIHRALITTKSRESRSYRIADFSMDTAPSRIVEAMSTQSINDWTELRAAANNYIRTSTRPIVRTTYDSFFDMGGAIPTFTFLLGDVNSYLWYI